MNLITAHYVTSVTWLTFFFFFFSFHSHFTAKINRQDLSNPRPKQEAAFCTISECLFIFISATLSKKQVFCIHVDKSEVYKSEPISTLWCCTFPNTHRVFLVHHFVQFLGDAFDFVFLRHVSNLLSSTLNSNRHLYKHANVLFIYFPSTSSSSVCFSGWTCGIRFLFCNSRLL